LIDFSANINPFGPPPTAVNLPFGEWQRTRAYPDVYDFLEFLSNRCRVKPQSLIVGNGSAALIFAAARAVSPTRALILEPGFSEYGRALLATGCNPYTHFLAEAREFRADVEELCDLITAERIDLVFFNNPHNPSGSYLPGRQVLELADGL
jgi:threonine-phosphate decarboxylase